MVVIITNHLNYPAHFHSLAMSGLDYQDFVALEKKCIWKRIKNFFPFQKNTGCQLQRCTSFPAKKKKNGPNTPVPEVVLVFNVIVHMSAIR